MTKEKIVKILKYVDIDSEIVVNDGETCQEIVDAMISVDEETGKEKVVLFVR